MWILGIHKAKRTLLLLLLGRGNKNNIFSNVWEYSIGFCYYKSCWAVVKIPTYCESRIFEGVDSIVISNYSLFIFLAQNRQLNSDKNV